MDLLTQCAELGTLQSDTVNKLVGLVIRHEGVSWVKKRWATTSRLKRLQYTWVQIMIFVGKYGTSDACTTKNLGHIIMIVQNPHNDKGRIAHDNAILEAAARQALSSIEVRHIEARSAKERSRDVHGNACEADAVLLRCLRCGSCIHRVDLRTSTPSICMRLWE